MQPILKYVEDKYIEKNDFPEFHPGDTITAYYRISEGDKSRTQFFRGVVIQIRGTGATKTFTIRKMSGTVGVERIFPINLPSLERIEVIKEEKSLRQESFISENYKVKEQELKTVCRRKKKLNLSRLLFLSRRLFLFKKEKLF